MNDEQLEKMMKNMNVTPTEEFKHNSFQSASEGLEESRKVYRRKKWMKKLFTFGGSAVVVITAILITFQMLMADGQDPGRATDPSIIDDQHDYEVDETERDENEGDDDNGMKDNDDGDTLTENDQSPNDTDNQDTNRAPYPGNEELFTTDGAFEGGEISDGHALKEMNWASHASHDRLVFHMYYGGYGEYDGPVEVPGYYTVEAEEYPFRLVYTLTGVRGFTRDLPDFTGSELFKNVRYIPTFDDSTIRIALEFHQPVEYIVLDLDDPGRIVTDVRAVNELTNDRVFSLRSRSFGEGDFEGINMKESTLWEYANDEIDNMRTLFSEGNTVFVEVGYFGTRAEAEQKLSRLRQLGIDFDLHIEERGMFDVPRRIGN